MYRLVSLAVTLALLAGGYWIWTEQAETLIRIWPVPRELTRLTQNPVPERYREPAAQAIGFARDPQQAIGEGAATLWERAEEELRDWAVEAIKPQESEAPPPVPNAAAPPPASPGAGIRFCAVNRPGEKIDYLIRTEGAEITYVIKWGDGQQEEGSLPAGADGRTLSHSFAATGTYVSRFSLRSADSLAEFERLTCVQ